MINWSEHDGRYWINDGDDVLWFDSILDAKDMVRKLEIKLAVANDRAATIKWLRRDRPFYDLNPLADELEIDFERRDDEDSD